MLRFDKSGQGVINAEDFRKMWRQTKEGSTQKSIATTNQTLPTITPALPPQQVTDQTNSQLSFEAGKLFSQFDKDGDGKLNKKEFESVLHSYPEISKSSSSEDKHILLPTEVVTGTKLKLLYHD